MANTMYDSAKALLLGGGLDWDTDDIRAILIDLTDYTPNFSVHDFLDDVPAAAREEVSGAMTCSISAGVADAADVTFSSTSGDACDAILVYRHTGTDSTSNLICLIDTGSGLPVTLGGDVTVRWHANGVFNL